MITLFYEPRPVVRDPYSVALSALLHSGVIGLVSAGFMLTPRVQTPLLARQYPLRLIRLDLPLPQKQPDPVVKDRPTPHADVKSPAPSEQKSLTPSPSTPPAPSIQFQASKVHQTIVQPNAPPDLVLPSDIPLPSVMLWNAADDAKYIVPPTMQQVDTPRVTPSLQTPNKADRLADTPISPTAFSSDKMPVMPASTTPIAVQGPQLQQPSQLRQTSSKSNDQSAHARIMALSDLVMPDGTTAIPRVNQIASGSPTVRLEPGNSDQPAKGDLDGSAVGAGSHPSTKHITTPKNGKFSMVLVGNSLEEQYPETAGIWAARLAYTVYLHVNQPKPWIMQFSLPRLAEAPANGNAARLEAPWPTDMVVPNFAFGDINSNAVLVHATLNVDGHFEKLSIVFPPQFAQGKFLIETLQKWQFRPAQQNAQKTPVEVLLIIPQMEQ